MAQSGLIAGRTLVLRHEGEKRLYDYWNALRQTRTAPARHEIDPAALRHALPLIFVLEAESRDYFHFKIAGTSLCSAFGRELRDHDFCSLWDDNARAPLRELLSGQQRHARGALVRFSGATLDKTAFEGEMLLLPLSDMDGRLTRTIGHFHLTRGIEALALRKLVRLSGLELHALDPSRDRILLEDTPRAPLPGRPLAVVKTPSPTSPVKPQQPWADRLSAFLRDDDQ